VAKTPRLPWGTWVRALAEQTKIPHATQHGQKIKNKSAVALKGRAHGELVPSNLFLPAVYTIDIFSFVTRIRQQQNNNKTLKCKKKKNILEQLVFITQRRQWHPTPVLLPGKSHGWRSLVGFSPWGLKESDTTEWLHFHFSRSYIGGGNGNPLQYSCLENPGDGGAWWAAIHGVAQSQTRLKWLSSSSSSSIYYWAAWHGKCKQRLTVWVQFRL